MDRRLFLVSATGIAMVFSALTQGKAATPLPVVAATPLPGYSPGPVVPHSHRYRGGYAKDHDLRHVSGHLEAMIASLQADTNDYCGHRTQAIGYLQQARDQLQASLSCTQQP